MTILRAILCILFRGCIPAQLDPVEAILDTKYPVTLETVRAINMGDKYWQD